MANFIKRTKFTLRQPLACFGAFAAGCLISGQLTADENDNPKVQETKLERLLADEAIQFSPVPPMDQTTHDSLLPLRQIVSRPQPAPTDSPTVSQIEGPSAAELMGVIKQFGSQCSTESKARMLMPVAESSSKTVQTYPLQQVPASEQSRFHGLPAGRLGSRKSVSSDPHNNHASNDKAFSAAQVSWQEPSYNDAPGFQQMPLSQAPAARVASSAPANVAVKNRNGIHHLSQVSMQGFESAVVAAWGNRLRIATSPDGRYVRVEIPTRVPQRMSMLVDRETQTLSYEGDDSLRDNWHRLVERLDSVPRRLADGRVQQTVLVGPNRAELKTIQQAAFLMGLSQDITQPAGPGQDITKPGQEQSITLPPGTALPQGLQQGVKDTVKILQDPDTGAITLVGTPEDIAIVKKIIEEISAASKEKQALVKRIPLTNLQSEAIAEQLQEIYDTSYAPSAGAAKIEPLSSPNALVVVGQPAGISAVEELIAAMDVEGGEMEQGGFKTFSLKFLSAVDAKSRLDSFFNQANTGQGTQLPSPPVTVVADFRSNSVTVKGAKQFIDQAEQYLKTIDVAEVDGKTNTVKVFPLRNTLAEEMAIVLQDAISGQMPNAGQGYNPNQQAQQAQQNQNQQIQPTNSSLGSAQLSLKMIGQDGREVKSGIMFDVRVTADKNSNSLVVTGPEQSMDLVATLIEQLDRIPNAETQIKVFEIVNGDAESLLTMLETLFGSATTQQVGATGTSNLSQLPLQKVSATDGSALINLRFSFDTRTNTIIASGPAGDLQVVEDILNRLDAQDVTDRKPRVYRLSNAPALDVVDAINAYLEPRNDIVTNDPRSVGAFIQADRSVIVVAEIVSNSVIVSATPAQRAEIEELIRGLDRRPPMVKVKVLIAQVDLGSAEEFGVDIGIQDSLLFDRGTSVLANGQIDQSSAPASIGFPFLGTPGATSANKNAVFPGTLAGQALSTLGVGTINNTLGYGGLVLSASNESVSILMRALKDKAAVRVLSRPQITTVENLQGRVQIGASVPRISGTTQSNFGTTQNITFEDVGVILEVTPRVSPDGMIVMAVNVVKSSVGDQSEGITIGYSQAAAGQPAQPIIAPQINETTASTTLMARSGQTVVFSGLIEENKVHRKRGAPIISDLPWVGPLFSYEQDLADRSELLIIMTPYLIDDDQDIDTQNQDEMERMHWCLCDVAEIYGNTDYRGFEGNRPGIETIYPDVDPSGLRGEPLYKVIDAQQPGFESRPPQAQSRPRNENEVHQASHSTQAGRN